ncbi:hypothetical protein HFO56_19205 [Rhizobium laguerreae]|uniref:hypothetical protein n=1 Tax=Rhizobium laguerreae TaxID=1076926 RepID=UPI001C90751D|nr:hypothetical protein [Rhizobium laguerreae]MBY3154465.1 hypothetical protein [Rhizobium laguerreae]
MVDFGHEIENTSRRRLPTWLPNGLLRKVSFSIDGTVSIALLPGDHPPRILMLQTALSARYPLPGHAALRTRAVALCLEHLASGLGDDNAEQRLCSAIDAVYWQQLSEVLLADQLSKIGFQPQHAATGPDFLIEHAGLRIWIEVICPEPMGIPGSWLQPVLGEVTNLPHEAMLLRWTAAIKEKSGKLIGTPANPQGYFASNIVAADDIYVIAINGRLLRGGFSCLEGISQLPFAVEAVFSIGPYAIHIDRQTLETAGQGHLHRPLIPKPNGAQVPADTFLDPRFAPISAIWAVDLDENIILDRPCPMVVVHNPAASNPLPQTLLPAFEEYIAVVEGDYYRLSRINGRMSATTMPSHV